MNPSWPRLRWPSAVVAGGLLAFLALITHEEGWDWLGVQHLTPYFFDLVAILAAGQAWSAGRDVYAPNPFDPGGRPHVYGPWWLAGGPLGLTTGDARWLGWLLVLAFFITVAAVLAPRRPAAVLVALLLLLSPPVLYGVERGNNDLVVFMLFAAAGALLARVARNAAVGQPESAGWLTAGPAAGLLWLAAALKIYPLVALPALAAQAGSRRRTLGWLGGTAGACLAVFLLWRTDYQRAMAIVPRPETIFAYGWSLLPLAWEKIPLQRGPLLLAVLPVIALVGGWGWARRRALLAAVPLTGAATAWYVTGALAWLFCWAANTNYPYRAVLLLLPAGLWLAHAQTAEADASRATVARVQLAGCVLLLWLWPLKSWWAVALNSGRTGADRCLVMVFGVEQALVLGLNFALTLGVAGWAWRWWHTPDAARMNPRADI